MTQDSPAAAQLIVTNWLMLGRQGILERCLRRLEWDRVQEREAAAAASQAEAERLAMQSIDW